MYEIHKYILHTYTEVWEALYFGNINSAYFWLKDYDWVSSIF